MTAHWIGVEDGRWKMRSVVIGFKALPGDHSGENLRRYLVCLLDHVGIMDKKKNKGVLIISQLSCGLSQLIVKISCIQQH